MHPLRNAAKAPTVDLDRDTWGIYGAIRAKVHTRVVAGAVVGVLTALYAPKAPRTAFRCDAWDLFGSDRSRARSHRPHPLRRVFRALPRNSKKSPLANSRGSARRATRLDNFPRSSLPVPPASSVALGDSFSSDVVEPVDDGTSAAVTLHRQGRSLPSACPGRRATTPASCAARAARWRVRASRDANASAPCSRCCR
jgi:hypothetical protein